MQLKAKESSGAGASTELLWGKGSERVSQELRLLRDALGNVDFDPSLYKEDAPTVVDKILQDVEAMFAIFAWQGRQELPREARAAIKQTAGTRLSTRTLVPGLFC